MGVVLKNAEVVSAVLEDLRATKNNVNKPDARGRIPLRLAMELGYFHIAKLLIDAGANIQKELAELYTTSYDEKKSSATKKRSVQHSASPTSNEISTDKQLEARVLAAVLIGNVTALKALVRHNKRAVNASESDEGSCTTMLCIAAIKGRVGVVKVLLQEGASVNNGVVEGGEHADEHMTPLYAAAYMGYSEVVALLLQHGADPRIGSKL